MATAEKRYHRVLTIAGSDSGGGAGIQADVKTISAHGCYGMSVITSLTAQNTVGVHAIHDIPVDFIIAQMDAIFDDIGADAVKVGMLFSAQIVEAVAQRLEQHQAKNIVLDPVMIAQSGDTLLRGDAIEVLKKKLMPLADLITPNLPEASVLLGRNLRNYSELEDAAHDLAEYGCRNVLIKGGHLEDGTCNDLLYLGSENTTVALVGKRIATTNNHGTGCTLSSAIASGLAKKLSVKTAVLQAKKYVTHAIASGAMFSLGKGHGPVHHFFHLPQNGPC